MFSNEIKKYIADMNARVNGAHHRGSSQPAGGNSGQVKHHAQTAATSSGSATAAPDINELKAKQAQPRGQTAGVGTRGASKINLEAYEAYHNSKENAMLLSQTKSEEAP